VPRINPHELKAVMDAGEAVIVVDTRTREQFEQRHIAGAISMPSDEVHEQYGELPRAGDVVFY
jgi:rhodanese-related sulfurtransferase